MKNALIRITILASTIMGGGGGVIYLKTLPEGQITNNTPYNLILVHEGKLKVIEAGETKPADGVALPIITQNCTVFSVSPAIKVANGETVEINSKNIGILTNQQEIIYKEHTNSILQFYKFLRNYREGKETRGVMKIYDLTHKNKSDNLIPNIEPYNDNIFSVGGLASYQFKKNKEQAPDKVFEELEALNPESKNVFSVQVQKLFELSDKNLNICKTRG